MSSTIEHKMLSVRGTEIAVALQGSEGAPAVLLSHSILAAGMMWDAQAALLAAQGWRVINMDTRGHGASKASPAPYTMDGLADDAVAVLDALGVAKAHFVGLSLGGMIGFGLGVRHASRLLSLCLCDARADAPAAFAAPWDERITAAQSGGAAVLAQSTVERWFGKAFVDANPAVAERFRATISATPLDGFVGCARALQGLDYLKDVAGINAPTTLIVGANDGPLPGAMEEIRGRIAGARLDVIPDAGHLPNIDQPAAFNAALLAHFLRAGR
ncbi:MAG: alpha/beta hydrolase [Candidatus Protistobacter heckmanni]|nr:alpha/beta hydrolase [Candidatus Protistobacter heckmanni]